MVNLDFQGIQFFFLGCITSPNQTINDCQWLDSPGISPHKMGP